MKDYYYILGIDENASQQEIKKAYRKLSLKFHPDTNKGDKFFENRFKEINEAYELLTDAVKRQSYDYNRQNRDEDISGKNFSPYIEFFVANKEYVEFGEIIEFKWKCINTTKVEITPFGQVEYRGSKRFKIKNYYQEILKFKLKATNQVIGESITEEISINNKTYLKLKNKIISEYLKTIELKNKSKENTTEEKNIDERVIVKITSSGRKFEIHTVDRGYSIFDRGYDEGDRVTIDGEVAEDGVYKFGMFEKLIVKDGRLKWH